METPFGITREELLELAANKLADGFRDEDHLSERVRKLIEERVKNLFESTLKSRIDEMLMAEMTKLLAEEICPVDIYGHPTGKPTSMRAVFAERARVFWNEKVDSDGRATNSYGANERHVWLFSKIVNEEFNKAVKQNIVNLVGGFKDALSEKAAEITKEHIDSLIKVKTSRG